MPRKPKSVRASNLKVRPKSKSKPTSSKKPATFRKYRPTEWKEMFEWPKNHILWDIALRHGVKGFTHSPEKEKEEFERWSRQSPSERRQERETKQESQGGYHFDASRFMANLNSIPNPAYVDFDEWCVFCKGGTLWFKLKGERSKSLRVAVEPEDILRGVPKNPKEAESKRDWWFKATGRKSYQDAIDKETQRISSERYARYEEWNAPRIQFVEALQQGGFFADFFVSRLENEIGRDKFLELCAAYFREWHTDVGTWETPGDVLDLRLLRTGSQRLAQVKQKSNTKRTKAPVSRGKKERE